MREDIVARLRGLPKVDAVLERPEVRALAAPRWAVLDAIRQEIDGLRERILRGADIDESIGPDGDIRLSMTALSRRVADSLAPSMVSVINATGVVLHTNLGRAPIAQSALDSMVALGRGYSNLEYDVSNGRRGSRHAHLASLITNLTGAEDAVVVNNCAGAVMLCLAALAAGRDAIVSRGELVEIGGSFRVPDVMRLSGVRLVEVGTTNKTRVADYRDAMSEDTGLLLKIHRSNFAVVGFTEETSRTELAVRGQATGVTTMMDVGSGSLLSSSELAALGLTAEPSVAQVISSGVDVVAFSGDKLLGGPQAGIICGRAQPIAAIRKHPLMRALRTDKLILAALEATLIAYRDGHAREHIPTWKMLSSEIATLERRARQMVADIMSAAPADRALDVRAVACESTVGGGAMPLTRLPSFGLSLRSQTHSTDALEAALRALPTPIIGRIAGDRVLLDVRTVLDDQTESLVRGVVAAMQQVRHQTAPGTARAAAHSTVAG